MTRQTVSSLAVLQKRFKKAEVAVTKAEKERPTIKVEKQVRAAHATMNYAGTERLGN